MKKQFFLGKMLTILVFVLLAFSLNSCRNADDVPETPVNETVDKGHEEWAKVVFTFREGHLHGKTFHGSPFSDAIPHLKSKQEYAFVVDAKGNVKPENNTPIRMVKDSHYALEITYYNKKGEVINGEFTTKEMAPIHQHFFISKDVKDINTGAAITNTDNLDYTYRDTDPWNEPFNREKNNLRGEKDPIGLKGYFFAKGAYQTFDLNIILVHVVKGNKLDTNGNPYPFNQPSVRLLATQDLNLKVPVRIYTKHAESDAELQQYYKDIAKEFGITVQEAIDEVNAVWDIPFESSNYWM